MVVIGEIVALKENGSATVDFLLRPGNSGLGMKMFKKKIRHKKERKKNKKKEERKSFLSHLLGSEDCLAAAFTLRLDLLKFASLFRCEI